MKTFWLRSRAPRPGLIRFFFHSQQCFFLINSSNISPNHLNSSRIPQAEHPLWFLISHVAIARLAYKSVVEFTWWNLLAHGASVLGLEIIGCYSTSECWSSLSIQRRYILEVRLSTRKTDSSNFSSGFSTSLHARLDLCGTATDPNWLPFSGLWAPSSQTLAARYWKT